MLSIIIMTQLIIALAVLGMLALLLGLLGMPISIQTLSREANSDERVLKARLEELLPGTSRFYDVRLRRHLKGWVCATISRVPSLPWHDEIYVWGWGMKPSINKIASKLVRRLKRFTPQAKAYELAQDILGHEGIQQVMSGIYSVSSQINPSVMYKVTLRSIILYRERRLLGSFCLQSRGEYPLWDVVLSRILMIRGSELEFLRTAYFYGSYGSVPPPYFARPMTREEFKGIYG